jgi:peptidylprolyl isomerase domain and WD repeat-containing protein 1
MAFNPINDTVVSIDQSGMIEYWQYQESEESGFGAPTVPTVSFQFKSDTDLYEFKKLKTTPTSLTFSPNFKYFATFGVADQQIRIFTFRTGKLFRKYDESIEIVKQLHENDPNPDKMDDMDFGLCFLI